MILTLCIISTDHFNLAMKLETNEHTEATLITVSNRTTTQNYANIAQSQIEELQKFKKIILHITTQ
jgi:hypothetical protein